MPRVISYGEKCTLDGDVASELLNRFLRHEISVEEFFSEADELPDEDLKVLRELLKDRIEEINRTFR